jgi:SAM-dependent methyltransferase
MRAARATGGRELTIAPGLEEHIYEQLYALEDEHWWFRGRRAVMWALLGHAHAAASPRVLDAGCGTGRNLAEYGSAGRAEGVDPSASAVAFCHARGLQGVTQGEIEALPFDDGSFDLILATDVLEHVERDDAALAELRRVAAPGARLLVTVPAYRWLWSQHDDSHHHLRRYTAPVLAERARRAGWEPVRRTYFNTLLLPPIALVRLLARRRGHEGGRTDYELTRGAVHRALELPMRLEAGLIRRGLRLPAGVSIGMVCRAA